MTNSVAKLRFVQAYVDDRLVLFVDALTEANFSVFLIVWSNIMSNGSHLKSTLLPRSFHLLVFLLILRK